MKQSATHNEQTFDALIQAISASDHSTLFLIICQQASWSLSISEQISEEIDTYTPLILDCREKQINSISQLLAERLPEHIQEGEQLLIHLIGMENSLLPEILEDKNELIQAWGKQLMQQLNAHTQICIWTDSSTKSRFEAEVPELWENISQQFEFKEEDKDLPKQEETGDLEKLEQLKAAGEHLALTREYLELGDFDQAFEYAQKGIHSTAQDPIKLASYLQLSGRICGQQAKWSEALKYYRQSLKVDGQEEATRAETQFRVGNILATNDRPEIAQSYYEQVVESVAEGTAEFVAKSHRNLGVLYINRGDVDTAFEHYEQALDGLEEAESWESLAFTHQQIADVFVNIQQIEDALEHHQAAVDYFEKVDAYDDQGKNYRRMARLRLMKGNMQKVFSHYERAIDAFQQKNNYEELANSYQQLAAVHQDQLNWAEALSNYQAALVFAQKLQDTFMIESLEDSIENMQAEVTASTKKKKGILGGLFGKKK